MSTPIIFINSFLIHFTLGGLTGMVLSSSALDVLLTETLFVVGHFHLVLALSAVDAISALFYVTTKRILKRPINEQLSRISAILFSYGSTITFVTMMLNTSMSRRYPHYTESYAIINFITTFGSIIGFISFSLFVL
jgi:cytochrome c oxidase subunit 1